MGTPQIAANAQAGIGDSIVAYGYAMSGTTLAACATPSIVTTILFSTTNIFTGARYQGIVFIESATPTYGPSTTVGVRIESYGDNSLYTNSPVQITRNEMSLGTMTSTNT